MVLRITSLVENTKSKEHLGCESGLSLLVEWQNKTYLIDTGASELFLDNAGSLGMDIAKVDYVIVTHGHSDHSGGVRALCQTTNKKFQLVLNLHFFDKKFKQEGEYLRHIGNDFNEEYLQTENVATVFPLTDTCELEDGVYVLSGIQPTEVGGQQEETSFVVLSNGAYAQDSFQDEQIMVFDTALGLVVMVGCAHSGVENIVETVKQRLQKPVYAVIGGLHLKDSGDERIEKTIGYIREEGFLLATGHCTGERAMLCLEAAFPDLLSLSSGTVIQMDEA